MIDHILLRHNHIICVYMYILMYTIHSDIEIVCICKYILYIYLELPSPFKFCHFRSVTLFFLNRPLFWQTRHFDPNNQFPLIPMVFHPKPEPQDKMAQKC